MLIAHLDNLPNKPFQERQKGQLLWEYKPDFSAAQVEQSHEAVEAEAVQAVGDVQNVVLTEKLTNDTETFGPLKHKSSKCCLIP